MFSLLNKQDFNDTSNHWPFKIPQSHAWTKACPLQRKLNVEGKQNSLFHVGPCIVILRNSKLRKNVNVLDRYTNGWHTDLTWFQLSARPDDVRADSLCYCFPRKSMSFGAWHVLLKVRIWVKRLRCNKNISPSTLPLENAESQHIVHLICRRNIMNA